MIELSEQHFMYVDTCPWCGATSKEMLYQNHYMAKVQKCLKCGFVYSDKILNKSGLNVYWSQYLSEVQRKDEEAVVKRNIMYQLEFQFINQYINCKGKNVLDIGCGNGDFLDLFKQKNAQCYGVEYGTEAIQAASARYPIWAGEFPYIKDINISFDLIIFRGSLQYCISPKEYLKRAMELLNSGGVLYITSSPNAQSLCFQLFKENFTLPVGVTDYYAFSEPILTEYIGSLQGRLIGKYQFYEETPYASPYDDIVTVAKAIAYRQQNKSIDFKSPAFYDNMLTLVYTKN
jgi:2-polyprenyl-3-methyl-5-hydroxy-6-metoxy-1,4-benzoquinol methylase